MARTIDRHHVAVIYETVTGQNQLRTVISTDGFVNIDKYLSLHSIGMREAIIIPRISLPGADHNEKFFRQTIAAATGVPLFKQGMDRAVQVNKETGIVVSVHNGNVPGLDKPDFGHDLISHPTAEIGHYWNGKDFISSRTATTP